MSGARVVVTGATGFIGRRVVEALAPDHDVFAVSRAGEFASGVTAVEGDLGSDWTSALPERADALVWLAQSRRYREFPAGAADMFRVNEAALFAALEWARQHGVRRFVYASTGSVYAPASGALGEDAPVAATTFYAATKLNGEHLVRQYAGCFEVVIGRIFGVYGPGQAGMAVARVVAAAAAGETVTLRGGTGMEFTPLYIDDAAAIIAALAYVRIPENPLVLNLAGPETTSLAAIAATAASIAGRPPKLTVEAGDPARLIADTTRLRAVLPQLEFHDVAAGVAATVAALGAAEHGSR